MGWVFSRLRVPQTSMCSMSWIKPATGRHRAEEDARLNGNPLQAGKSWERKPYPAPHKSPGEWSKSSCCPVASPLTIYCSSHMSKAKCSSICENNLHRQEWEMACLSKQPMKLFKCTQTCSNPYSLKKWFWNLIIRNAQDAAEPKGNYYLNKSRLTPSKVWIFCLRSASKEKMKKGIELCS